MRCPAARCGWRRPGADAGAGRPGRPDARRGAGLRAPARRCRHRGHQQRAAGRGELARGALRTRAVGLRGLRGGGAEALPRLLQRDATAALRDGARQAVRRRFRSHGAPCTDRGDGTSKPTAPARRGAAFAPQFSSRPVRRHRAGGRRVIPSVTRTSSCRTTSTLPPRARRGLWPAVTRRHGAGGDRLRRARLPQPACPGRRRRGRGRGGAARHAGVGGDRRGRPKSPPGTSSRAGWRRSSASTSARAWPAPCRRCTSAKARWSSRATC